MRVLAFLLAISIGLNAQESDSLMMKIQSVKSDTERVNQLYRRGFALRTRSPQLSFEYAKRCEQAALLSRSKKHLAKSYNLLGILYYRKGDYKTALAFHQKALRLRQECNDVLGIALSQTNLGNVYSDIHQYGMAETSYLKALEAYRLLNDKERMIGSLVNIGTIKHRFKQYDLAIEFYNMAMEQTGINEYDTKAMCLTNLGEAYLGRHMVDKAVACNEDALKLRILSDNQVEMADNYLNLGGIYVIRSEFEKAKRFIDTAFNIATRHDYFELKYEALKVYAYYYSATKNFEQAFKMMQRYHEVSDSLAIISHSDKLLYDFNSVDTDEGTKAGAQGIANPFLLVLILLPAIVIPFYLIRYKR